MTAKIDLIAKLTALMPECAREIIKIMREYDVQTAQVYDRSNLPRRVEPSSPQSASTAAARRRSRAIGSGSSCS